MIRTDLLAALRAVAPALSSKDLVPAFSHLWFNGKTVTAYDDATAITVPCDFPFKGGLKGTVLTGLLGASKAKDVIVDKQEGDVLYLKVGRSKLKIPVLDPEMFVFEPPAKHKHAIPLTPSLVDAILSCQLSMGLDPAEPWRMGISARFYSKEAQFYSSDNLTVTGTGSVIDDGPKKALDLIFPPRFVELFASLFGSVVSSVTMRLSSGWVEIVQKDGIRLFSKTVSDARVTTFESLLNSVKWDVDKFSKVPKTLSGILERALVIMSGSDDQHISLSVSNGKLTSVARSASGEAKDVVKFEHKDAECRVAPALLSRMLHRTELVSIVPGKAIALASSNKAICHMISVVGGE